MASLLIFMAFGYQSLFTAFIFLTTLLAILAAIRYTVGKRLMDTLVGDVFVFLFFGMLSVLGSAFCFHKPYIGT